MNASNSDFEQNPHRVGIYTIRDRKADECAPLFISKNHATALRMFEQACGSSDELRRYPDDYELLFMGFYDMYKASIEPIAPAVFIASGADFSVKEVNNA